MEIKALEVKAVEAKEDEIAEFVRIIPEEYKQKYGRNEDVIRRKYKTGTRLFFILLDGHRVGTFAFKPNRFRKSIGELLLVTLTDKIQDIPKKLLVTLRDNTQVLRRNLIWNALRDIKGRHGILRQTASKLGIRKVFVEIDEENLDWSRNKRKKLIEKYGFEETPSDRRFNKKWERKKRRNPQEPKYFKLSKRL